jgi:hypothetical protein
MAMSATLGVLIGITLGPKRVQTGVATSMEGARYGDVR